MAFINLYPRSWDKVDTREVEDTILHEMYHLAFPTRVALSGHGTNEDGEEAIERGILDLIRKHARAVLD